MSLTLTIPGLPDRILTGRVNPVPPGGTITINGKKPVAISMENKTGNSIFCILKVNQEPIIDETVNLPANNSISFFVDRTTIAAAYDILITNQSKTDSMGTTIIENCMKK